MHFLVGVLVSAALIASAAYYAWVSMYADTRSFPGLSVLQALYLLAWTIPLAILIFGIGHAILARRIETGLGWMLVALFCSLLVYLFYSLVTDCEVSAKVRRVMKEKLSPAELATVQPDGRLCPTAYQYSSKDSNRTVVVFGAADIIHGTKVWFDE